ncbi:hypothetical protein D8827_04325 [Streptococcus intermedius]|uniref:DUF1310 domain-containing protein n=1 Tax=Streptococcus intermedius TaxID=1338 RepID=A0AAE8KBY1_STRIT|nr:DUF1310 family protein [Streptococcus intermedius]RSJ18730.1 hypothetical protein D8829_09465 [Streptococcus intermedius]RSJ23742.1 hypothetical protein D8827_04325 [Streptococcus intermedius]RSJ25838.1 hypothetical protein D8826_06710 [Streptococcus intermedius]
MKKVLLILGAVLLGTMIAIGGCKVQGKSQKEQMLEIVKSEEVKKIIEETLKNEDSKALTNEGVIKSYQIDEKSIKHNPMGGIMFNIIINNDKELYGMFGLQKDSQTQKIRGTGMDLSVKLSKLIEREK